MMMMMARVCFRGVASKNMLLHDTPKDSGSLLEGVQANRIWFGLNLSSFLMVWSEEEARKLYSSFSCLWFHSWSSEERSQVDVEVWVLTGSLDCVLVECTTKTWVRWGTPKPIQRLASHHTLLGFDGIRMGGDQAFGRLIKNHISSSTWSSERRVADIH